MKYLNIGNPGAYLLADVLKNDPVIVQLTLSAARMTDEGIVELCKAIPTMHRLKYLDLSSNCMTDVGAIALSEAILDHRTLRILSVAGNRIKLSGIVNIASAIVSSHINLYAKQKRVSQKLEEKQKTLSAFHFPEEGGDSVKDPGVVNKENRIIWCR
jgi:Ran GTPase-activating protein (RanGAP) involved in mRNA processing and transport